MNLVQTERLDGCWYTFWMNYKLEAGGDAANKVTIDHSIENNE